MEKLFSAHKVLIVVGSGGVGKTTVSASLGALAAKRGLRVLVMTIDPARRLRVALGLDENAHQATLVPNQTYEGKLYATLLKADEIFRDFIVRSSSDAGLADRLLKNQLYRQLSTTLSGSQEFTSLLQLTRVVNATDYDLVILDTPPAQHAIEFLEAPEKIHNLFQESIVKWFLSTDDQTSFVRKVISRGTTTVLGALERITGARFMVELREFFESVRVVQSKISEKTEEVQKILAAKDTGFVLVTGFDEAKLEEAEQLYNYLGGKGYHMVATLINRAFPTWMADSGAVTDAELRAEYEKWQKYNQSKEAVYAAFYQKYGKILPVVRIPDLNRDLNGLKGLEGMADEIQKSFVTAKAGPDVGVGAGRN